jgi:AcrR family transcriptional regulator
MGTAKTPLKNSAAVSGREAILDAAEQTFGSHGFDGGSMSQIAQLAGVAQSLLHYHYKTKDLLYEAVFERRATQIHGKRQARLEAIFARASKVHVEEVLEILFISLEEILELKESELRHYVRMVADVTLASNERSVPIVKRFYDPSAELFIAAIRKIYPELSRDEAVWCYLFAIGGRMQAHASVDRAVRLGSNKPNGRKQYGILVTYAAAGIKAIAKARL